MDDEQLIKDFILVGKRDHGIEIKVCQISWPTPDWPVEDWTVVTELPSEASKEQIDKTVRLILADCISSACARSAVSANRTVGCTTLKCAMGVLEPFTDTWTA